jgi:hypothetical protein
MNEGLKPRINRKLVKESCFGTYVLSANTFKSYMLTQVAYDVVKIIDGNKTVEDLADLIGVSHKLDIDLSRKRVSAVIDELQKLGAVRLE